MRVIVRIVILLFYLKIAGVVPIVGRNVSACITPVITTTSFLEQFGN